MPNLKQSMKETNTMKNLYNRNYTRPFVGEFNAAVLEVIKHLTFNTREEYLNWVKQWKEDYHTILNSYKRGNLSWFINDPKHREDKKLAAENRLAKLPPDNPEKVKEVMKRLSTELVERYGYPKWYAEYPSKYSIILYLLVSRRAGKIRAGQLRAERLALK